MNSDLSQKIEEQFACRRCNACCRQPGYVYLREGEAERMAEFLNLLVYDFTDRYCDVIDRRRLVLKKLPDETCVLFDGQGCRVHAMKPGQCRDFPLRWRTPEAFDYCQGLRKVMGEL